MQKSRLASALALSATAYLAGCHLIKVNGKPLGGGGSSSSSSSSSSAASDRVSSGSEPSASNASAAPAAAATGGSSSVSAEWCADSGYRPVSSRPATSNATAADFADVKLDDISSAEKTAGQFASVMCATNKVADFDKIMAIRARWMTASGIDERDFDVLASAHKGRKYEDQDWRTMPGPVSQVPTWLERVPSFQDLDQLGARASMLLRFRVVGRCLERGAEHNPLLRHILCTRERLDVAKANAEIDSTTDLNNGTRYKLRAMVKTAAAAAAKARADIAAKAKADPAIAKVIAIAEAQFKDWESPSATRAKLIEQLEAMEIATKANKHSAFAGCETKTRAAWDEHLKKLELPKVSAEKTLQTFLAATVNSPEGYLAYQALRLCSASKETLHKDLRVIGSDMIRRGPRTATLAAWLAAADIKFDDRALTMGFLMANGGLDLTNGSHHDLRQGRIAALEDFDGGVEITFKEVVEPREDCLHWKDTNQVVGFRPDGSPMYRRECLKWGTINMDLTAGPIRIGKLMAQGLKPGMYLIGIEGLAIVATAGPKSSKPVWVLGGSAK